LKDTTDWPEAARLLAEGEWLVCRTKLSCDAAPWTHMPKALAATKVRTTIEQLRIGRRRRLSGMGII
jgi:hypothetical protein